MLRSPEIRPSFITHCRALACSIGVVLLLAAAACDSNNEGPAVASNSSDTSESQRSATPAATDAAPSSADASSADPLPRVVFLGDSLTAGLGIDAEDAFPAVVGRLLAADGLPVQVVNAGVSGDTTAGGLSRLDWLLKQKPDVLVVGLGGNDGLRAISPEASEANLRQIVEKARAAGAKVVLLGMQMPPNYGPEYTQQFREIYPRLAKNLSVPLVPFMLEGVGGDASLNQADGIHPTAEGHRRVARTVLSAVENAVKDRSN